MVTISGVPSPSRSASAWVGQPLTCSPSTSRTDQRISPVPPRSARITPRHSVPPGSKKLCTTSGTRSPSRSITAGITIAWSKLGCSVALSTLHSMVGSKVSKVGSTRQVTGSNCGRQRSSVGSQKAPSGQS